MSVANLWITQGNTAVETFLFRLGGVRDIISATTVRGKAKTMQSTMQMAEHIGSVCPPETRSHEIVHRFRVKLADVGILGFVDGGTLLEWIETAGYATAAQWCGGHCVAASVGNLHLDRPIRVGEFVVVHATVVYTGRSSMHILITVQSTDATRAKAGQTAQCAMVFVAVNPTGHPVEVPRWTPVTMLELQRHRQARVRIQMRKRIEGAMAAGSYTAEGAGPRTTLRFRAAPTDINRGGNVRAGRVMRWIDETAYVCGADRTGSEVITSYIAGIRFYGPIFVGDVIEVTVRIIHTGPRSIHISVQVTTTDTQLVAGGLVVIVSLDERGDARPVPPWEPASEEDRRLDQHARHLIELRQFIEPFTTAAAFPADAGSANAATPWAAL